MRRHALGLGYRTGRNGKFDRGTVIGKNSVELMLPCGVHYIRVFFPFLPS